MSSPTALAVWSKSQSRGVCRSIKQNTFLPIHRKGYPFQCHCNFLRQSPTPVFMANAVTAYRDMSLSDRNTDAGDIAMLAYLDESAQPQPPPPPLPPLAPDRRKGSQNLPPVRNLLTQPEEWDQSKQNSSNKSKQNNVRRKVWLSCRTKSLIVRFQLSRRARRLL